MEFVARLIATLLWLVFGFILWIPLLARSVLALTFLYLKAAVERTSAPSFSIHNKGIVKFYSDGFEWIWSDQSDIIPGKKETETRWMQFVGALVTALIFWAPLFFFSSLWSNFFESTSTRSDIKSSVQIYAGALSDIIEPRNCRLFGGCSSSETVGTIQLQKVTTIPKRFFKPVQAVLEVRICSKSYYSDMAAKSMDLYFVDSKGDTVHWNNNFIESVPAGSCKSLNFELSDESEDVLSNVKLMNGTYYITFDEKSYQITV